MEFFTVRRVGIDDLGTQGTATVIVEVQARVTALSVSIFVGGSFVDAMSRVPCLHGTAYQVG